MSVHLLSRVHLRISLTLSVLLTQFQLVRMCFVNMVYVIMIQHWLALKLRGACLFNWGLLAWATARWVSGADR